MAAVASSAVTINDRFNSVANTGGKRQTVDATIVLAAQGDLTDNITASVLGLASIDAVLSCIDTDSKVYPCGPSYDRTKLVISSTSATTGAPTTITATVRVVVVGQPTSLFF